MITTNYNNATTSPEITRGEKDWYKLCSITISRLSKLADEDLLKSFVIHHIIDGIDVVDKKILINTLLTKSSLTDIERTIKEYIDDTLQVRDSGKTAYILIENKKIDLPDKPLNPKENTLRH